jgi:UDP-N-acetylglucosamine--N-acetylmuramyl-(pentapeptide) pyrophosphoryl-undecaprenol N-acetylglucosamine transferase
MPTRVRDVRGFEGGSSFASWAWSHRSSLIFGGSGGALKINLAGRRRFGAGPPTRWSRSPGGGISGGSRRTTRAQILEYVDDIWRYLAASSVVVSRAGAGSLFDIAAAG